MNKRSRVSKRPHRRHIMRSPLAPERLEERTLLDATNIFAQFRGVIPAAGTVVQIPITISPADFTLPGSRAVIGFRIDGGSGTLDPAAVTVRTSAGAIVTHTYSNADLLGKTQSLTLASLPFGSYRLDIAGDRKTSGTFRLDAFLAGDADGNHVIDLNDGALIRSIDGSIAGDKRYSVLADSNLDSTISSFDYMQWRLKLNNSTRITPLGLSLRTPEGVVTLPGGGLATRSASGLLSGLTEPSAGLALETGSDGKFDNGSATADSSGNFAIPYSLSAGVNSLQVRASDRFGQQQTAGITILLDTAAPSIQLTSPQPGVVTRSNPTFSGWVTDGLTGVAMLMAALDNAAPSPVTFDATGNFSFATNLPLDHSADGAHTLHLLAKDRVGDVSSVADRGFSLDTTPPGIMVTNPTAGATLDHEVTIDGVVTDAIAGVASLQVAVDGGTYSSVSFDGTRHFHSPAGLTLDGSADGRHTFHAKATDQFAGQQRDERLGLDYLRARYLNTATGRFTSKDPFDGFTVIPATLHRFLYAGNNPVMFSDPGGQSYLAEFAAAESLLTTLGSLALGTGAIQALLHVTSSNITWTGETRQGGGHFLFRGSATLVFLESECAFENGRWGDKVRGDGTWLIVSAGVGFGVSVPFALTQSTAKAHTPSLFGVNPWVLSGPFASGGFTWVFGFKREENISLPFGMGLGIVFTNDVGFNIGISLDFGISIPLRYSDEKC